MKPGGIGGMSGDAGALAGCEMETLMTLRHTALHVHS